MKLFLTLLLCVFSIGNIFANSVVWRGEANANGNPTTNVPLIIGKKYQIRVSGTINLGKWWQDGKPLIEDACYEYNEKVTPFKLDSIQNSLKVSLVNDKFNSNHVYESNPFTATQNRIHFWVHDTSYDDNTGSFLVEILDVTEK